MTHFSLSRALLCAGALALGAFGAAQAQTIYMPAGTTTYTYTYTEPYTTTTIVDPTTVLGAGPSTVTTYTYESPATVTYLTPVPVMICHNLSWEGASETSNVPLRAGEVSTMTGGAPNMVTNNLAC